MENGARADVFASADQRHMDLAIKAGLVSGGASNFASNVLVIVLPHAATAEASPIRSPVDLTKKGIKLAIAQPEVPAGNYTRAMIKRLAQDPRFGPDYQRQVLANVVSEEASVRNVLQKVVLGEVDAGIVYSSDARVTTDISVVPIPNEANVIASYTIALLRDSRQPQAAEAFLRFVLSPEGQEILGDHGFGPPVPGAPNSQEGS